MHPPTLSEASWEYNPLQVDAYLLYLASTHAQSEVIAADDIYSSTHSLIVKKDSAITPELAQSIMQSILAKPIEESVQLAWEIDAEKLLSDLTTVMREDDIFSAVNEHSHYLSLLAPLCQLINQFPILRQKLTIMLLALPEIYHRSLYSIWLSFCIAKEMRLSQDDIATVFMAALSHDIGMLHVNVEILQQTTPLTAQDWMQIQRHVVIGHQLLKSMKTIPSAVAQAVYEHHEQSDGTGYPLGKLENELGLFGQIINVADAIVAIYFNHHKDQGRSWRDIIPLIHMNASAYLTRANEVLLAILRRCDLPRKNVVQGDETPEFIAELLQKNEQLKLWFDAMRESLVSVGFRHGDKRLHALQNVMLHLATSAEGSGIFNDGKKDLLSAGDMPADFSQQVEKMHLMQQEIIFHLQRLGRMTKLYLESGQCKDGGIKFALTLGLKRTQKYLL